jgi:hypothetical protein
LIYKTKTRILPIDSKWIGQLMRKNLKKKEGKDKSKIDSILLNLSQYKTFEYLENLIKNKSEEEQYLFNQAFVNLKKWAKGFLQL